MPATEASLHALKSTRSSSATPSMRAIVMTGSGQAMPSWRSPEVAPPAVIPSISSLARASTVGAMRSTTLGVKALSVMRRNMVWPGGSSSMPPCLPICGPCPNSLDHVSMSRRPSSTSAWRDNV